MKKTTILDYLSALLLLGFAFLGLIVAFMNRGREFADTTVIFSPVGKLFLLDLGCLFVVVILQSLTDTQIEENKKR